jgi:hypothetical protein
MPLIRQSFLDVYGLCHSVIACLLLKSYLPDQTLSLFVSDDFNLSFVVRLLDFLFQLFMKMLQLRFVVDLDKKNP